MKKLLSLVLILSMLTVAMVSCKKDDPTPETPTPQGPNTPTPEVRTTITAEEWASACAMINYTMTSETTYTTTFGEEVTTKTITIVFNSSESAVHFYTVAIGMTGVDGPLVQDYYEVYDNGVLYTVEIKDGEVDYVMADPDDAIPTFDEYMDIETVEYTDLVYNSETKSYTFTQTSGNNEVPYTLWFENGKLVKVEATVTMEQTVSNPDGPLTARQVIEMSIVISDVGTTTVTVPAFTKPQE